MTFWQSIKTGFQNGNIAKWTQAIGMTTFTVGATGAMIHDLNKSSNCCCGGSIFDGMFGSNVFGGLYGGRPMMGGDLFGSNVFGGLYGGSPMMGGDLFGSNVFGGLYGGSPMMGGDLFGGGMFGGFDNYGSQYGQYIAAQAGARDFQIAWAQYQAQQAQMAQSTTQSVVNEKMDNECASKIDDNQSTELGTKFDEGTTALKNDDSYKLCNLDKDNENHYREEISKIGKSYGKLLDTNGDGYISEAEFTAHETKDVSVADKIAKAKIAFKKIDLNKDGKIDWKELSASITTYDLDSKDQFNGAVSKSDFVKWGELAMNQYSNKFDKALQKSYRYLFGSSEED